MEPDGEEGDRARTALFFCICVPLRVTIALLPLVLSDARLMAFAVLAALVSLGFLLNALATKAGLKTRGFLGGTVWWARLRWVHAVLWGAAAALAAGDLRVPCTLLLSLDVLLGASVRAAMLAFS